MKPIDFPQSTKVLQRPSTMTEQECQSLHVWNDGKQCVSCWKLSFKERMNVLFNGKVWLGVLSGKTQPPVFLSGECVFEKAPIKERLRAFLPKQRKVSLKPLKVSEKPPNNPTNANISLLVLWLLFLSVFWLPRGSVLSPDVLRQFSKNGGIQKGMARLKLWMHFSQSLVRHSVRFSQSW